MRIREIREFIEFLSPYLDMGSFIELNYDQVGFKYSGTLSEPVYNYLKGLGCISIGETYTEYVEHRNGCRWAKYRKPGG